GEVVFCLSLVPSRPPFSWWSDGRSAWFPEPFADLSALGDDDADGRPSHDTRATVLLSWFPARGRLSRDCPRAGRPAVCFSAPVAPAGSRATGRSTRRE